MNDVYVCVCILGWFLHKPWLLTCLSRNKAFYLFVYCDITKCLGLQICSSSTLTIELVYSLNIFTSELANN